MKTFIKLGVALIAVAGVGYAVYKLVDKTKKCSKACECDDSCDCACECHKEPAVEATVEEVVIEDLAKEANEATTAAE
jgi:hypothetical protein